MDSAYSTCRANGRCYLDVKCYEYLCMANSTALLNDPVPAAGSDHGCNCNDLHHLKHGVTKIW